ncbi:hypothetical protein [Lysinibacillus sp. Ag94]|uniref:hypothetical protein n=1 Tax=Lysinibacillus sp. Ag94 TaxID=2936682 RepID=UPI00200C68B3|nr:hypothetical protein [Lysinibacillus sp. Ag94]UPW84419.1 hypothetical protein MY533_05995 [Lysinibacillus sp. Ag94]
MFYLYESVATATNVLICAKAQCNEAAATNVLICAKAQCNVATATNVLICAKAQCNVATATTKQNRNGKHSHVMLIGHKLPKNRKLNQILLAKELLFIYTKFTVN